jgi:SAM-dependent methyltransferase
MQSESNTYSRRWFELFHVGIDETRTVRETEFVCSCAPLPDFKNILDVCCGMGRHARALSERGYNVTGVDRDSTAIGKARELGVGPNYVVADIRDYQPAPAAFDAAIVMGQSFGHFDSSTNRDVLLRLVIGLRKCGRVVLDLWNPEFFVAHQGVRELKMSQRIAVETKSVEGGRLFVQLDYLDDDHERFEWQLVLSQPDGAAGRISRTACPSRMQRLQFKDSPGAGGSANPVCSGALRQSLNR